MSSEVLVATILVLAITIFVTALGCQMPLR